MGAGAPIKVTIAFRTGFWAEGAMRRAYRWIGALAVALVACTPWTTTLASQEGDGNEQRRFAIGVAGLRQAEAQARGIILVRGLARSRRNKSIPSRLHDGDFAANDMEMLTITATS